MSADLRQGTHLLPWTMVSWSTLSPLVCYASIDVPGARCGRGGGSYYDYPPSERGMNQSSPCSGLNSNTRLYSLLRLAASQPCLVCLEKNSLASSTSLRLLLSHVSLMREPTLRVCKRRLMEYVRHLDISGTGVSDRVREWPKSILEKCSESI